MTQSRPMIEATGEKAVYIEAKGDKKWLTLCFECDVRKTQGNPFNVETPYGKPVIVAVGNLSEQNDDMLEALEEIADDFSLRGRPREIVEAVLAKVRGA